MRPSRANHLPHFPCNLSLFASEKKGSRSTRGCESMPVRCFAKTLYYLVQDCSPCGHHTRDAGDHQELRGQDRLVIQPFCSRALRDGGIPIHPLQAGTAVLPDLKLLGLAPVRQVHMPTRGLQQVLILGADGVSACYVGVATRLWAAYYRPVFLITSLSTWWVIPSET